MEQRVLKVKPGSGSALCFSGGGIRSAAFCLGIAQALGGAKLLSQFDYLSTVSGGGYIGGWLQQMLASTSGHERRLRADTMQNDLAAIRMPQLGRLRDFTNYLAPRLGAASPDTWAGIALYLRNFLVNWLVFLPLFLLIALTPIAHRTFIWASGAYEWWCVAITVLAFIAMGVSVGIACHWMPSQRQDQIDHWTDPPQVKRQTRARLVISASAILYAILLPVMLQYLLGTGWWDWVEPPDAAGSFDRYWRMAAGNLGLPAAFFVTLIVAFEIARLCAPRTRGSQQADHSGPRALFAGNRASWLWAACVSSAAFAVLLRALLWSRDQLIYWVPKTALPGQTVSDACRDLPQGVPLPDLCVAWVDLRADALTLGAPIVLLAVLLAHAAMYIGWRREARFGDLDREWLARLNGGTLSAVVAWTLFAFACILPSRLITLADGQVHGVGMTMSGLGAIASGFLSSWIGKQVTSRVTGAAESGGMQRLIGVAQVVLPLIFIVTVLAFLSAVLQDMLGMVGGWIPIPDGLGGEVCDRMRHAPCTAWARLVPIGLQILLAFLLGCALWKLAPVVNVNRFSMHAVYRNRLVRAFLGTARNPAERKPDPFTGFDNSDNPRLAGLTTTGPLFPVVNMTLNITTGERGAWAERKGASFTATPLYCGSGSLNGERGAFARTCRFGGMETEQDEQGRNKGIHLGSVMTISGAAASPNWGYHSNPLIALLMTLFNVRLGAWYSNPATASPDEVRLSMPRNSILAMLDELTGTARDDGKAIYLSDGGHFENLGVYEMLKRRCGRILVVDAGQDKDCAFFDLGMMIRKAEIDLPVRITLSTNGIASRKAIETSRLAGRLTGFASGEVTYYDRRGTPCATGRIIYIKPTLLSAVPAAIKAYARESEDFPHETTVDQFFSESQFESYRALGEYQGRMVLAGKQFPANDPLKGLFGG